MDTCNTCARPMAYGNRNERPSGTVQKSTARKCNACQRRAPGVQMRNTSRAPFIPEDGIVDDIAVEYACHGWANLRLTRRELQACIDKLTDNGESAAFIADILGVTERTVVRYRPDVIVSDPAPMLAAA